MMAVESCDTFVVMGDLTACGLPIFGKNSDRAKGEVQEIIYEKSQSHSKGTKLQCTYIEIEQNDETFAVVLSKPAWMWGAEMGANEFGVCVGNEAIFCQKEASIEERLLGMDLVRLALERSRTALEALHVITSLLEQHGQGGPCSEIMPGMTYNNSYLIVDPRECYVLETVEKMWVAEKISSGYRNISNCLTIGNKYDLCSDGLQAKVQELTGKTEVNFRELFCVGDPARYQKGQQLLSELTSKKSFAYVDMFKILRTPPISRSVEEAFPTVSSMVSVLSHVDSMASVHFVTATPDPQRSVFKPFIFTDGVSASPLVKAITHDNDPAKAVPRFLYAVDRSHKLYEFHASVEYDSSVHGKALALLETDLCNKVDMILSQIEDSNNNVSSLFHDGVCAEMKVFT